MFEPIRWVRVLEVEPQDGQQAKLDFSADRKLAFCPQTGPQPPAAWGSGAPVRPRCSPGWRCSDCPAAGPAPARERPRFAVTARPPLLGVRLIAGGSA